MIIPSAPKNSQLFVLNRPLLYPEVPTLEAMQAALITTVGNYNIPITSDRVHFKRADLGAIAILGGNTIEETLHSNKEPPTALSG